jgi:O-methyltransferase domain/Dimerisation domain
MHRPVHKVVEVEMAVSNSLPDPDSLSVAQASVRNAQIVRMSGAHLISQALYVLAELRIADHLKSGALRAEELAEKAGANAPALYRLLRTTAGYGYFTEDSERRFSLTALGTALQSDAPGHMRSWVMFIAGPTVWGAFGELLHSVRTGEESMMKAYGQSYFDFIENRSEQTRHFNEAMIAVHGTEPGAFAAAYDFAGLRKVVDVGGGTGNLLTHLLLANPHLQGVLYDRPDVAGDARCEIERKGLAERCETVEGSFFESVPFGGDAYILSHVLHDWDDGNCLKILSQVRRAMQGRGKLLVLEELIPPGNNQHPAKFADLLMLTITNGGRERSQQEYAELFAKAGFRLSRVLPTQSPSCVIEAELA